MSLSSNQLDAFLEVVRSGNFSKAAKSLHITQSALSQRILNLEKDMGMTLLIREPTGVRPSEVGAKLLRYCQKKQTLEEEFLGELGESNPTKGVKPLSGRIRVAAFSSIMHSAVFPALSKLLEINPNVQIEAHICELRELPKLLKQGVVDFVITGEDRNRPSLKSHLLGYEESVLIQPSSNQSQNGVFLDHDSEDRTTEEFFKFNGKSTKGFSHSYLDDIYGILEGVSLGWGQAIVPRHMLKSNPRIFSAIKISRNFKSMKTPVYLQYYDQPFYTALECAIIETILERIPKSLSVP